MTFGYHVEQLVQKVNLTRGQKYMTLTCTMTHILIIKSLLNVKCLLEWLVSLLVLLLPEMHHSDGSHHYHENALTSVCDPVEQAPGFMF